MRVAHVSRDSNPYCYIVCRVVCVCVCLRVLTRAIDTLCVSRTSLINQADIVANYTANIAYLYYSRIRVLRIYVP